MSGNLELWEKETIITFDEESKNAEIYTHSTSWQNHIENKLGLKPTATNNAGGKTYTIDKKRIPKPQLKRQYSEEEKAKKRERLANLRSTQ